MKRRTRWLILVASFLVIVAAAGSVAIWWGYHSNNLPRGSYTYPSTHQ